MSWIALTDPDTDLFSPRGLQETPGAPALIGSDADDLLPKGTFLIETRLPDANRPSTLFRYARDGDWPFLLSVQAIPGGGLIFVLNQGGSVVHKVLNVSNSGRMNVLRLSYCWDAPARKARLALEQIDQDQVLLVDIPGPCPLRVGDVRAMFGPGPDRLIAADVVFAALSSRIEPVGPLPSLHPETPIATPRGYRPLRSLRRGDTVLTAQGRAVPILQRLMQTVPARGSFRPACIRRPYFGLQQNILVSPSQRMVLTGTEVEYLFGRQAVLASARHLTGGHSVQPVACGPVVTYAQLLLPEHDTVLAAGSTLESLFIGRLNRKPQLLEASILSGLDRHRLPDHGTPNMPVLRPFEARTLAERRAA